jgi:hypothetical protein
MFKHTVRGLAALVATAVATSSAEAHWFKKDCCPPATCEVQKTCMVPQVVTEKRKVQCIEYRQEERECKYTVYKRVAETKQVEREVCEWVREERIRNEKYTVCKPVWTEEKREYSVLVPHIEKRQGTRKVCKYVQAKETRKVCVDEGCWEEVCCVTSCKVKVGCGGCCVVPVCKTRKVWKPNIVEKEVEVTVCRPQWVEEPYEYCVRVCKPEKRVCTVKVCHYEKEERTRECKYTVCVPKKKTVTCQVTTCKCVPEERTRKYTVCVPYRVEKEVEVKVCKMVPITVTCKVPCKPCPQDCCKPCCKPVCCN